MNAIRATQALNKRELENAVPPSASWHVDYRDTAYIYVGGLPLDLSEGDVVTIFSQYGNPTHLNMVRDKETGKSKGFAFLKYEDQRSCDLAVDNLGGAEVLGRLLRVDHTRYKKRDDEDEDTYRIDKLEAEVAGHESGAKRASDTEDEGDGERRSKKKRKSLKEEKELEEMLAIKQNGEEEDPMKEYLIQEKREEVQRARQREDDRERKHKHRHHRHRNEEDRDSKHRSRRHRDSDDSDDEKHGDTRSKRREGEDQRKDRRSHEAVDDKGHRRRRESSYSSDRRDRRKRDSSRDRHRDRSHERDKQHRRREHSNDRERK